MKKLTTLGLMAISAMALSACVNTELSSVNKQYDQNTDARIRLYGQNGRPTEMIVDPNGKAEKVIVGGSMGQAFGSLFHLKGNESIGMPESSFSKDPSQFNNIGSGAFYKEFIIPANTEIELKSSIDTPDHQYRISSDTVMVSSMSCRSKKVTFKSEAGKDYEAVPAPSTSQCGVTLIELKK